MGLRARTYMAGKGKNRKHRDGTLTETMKLFSRKRVMVPARHTVQNDGQRVVYVCENLRAPLAHPGSLSQWRIDHSIALYIVNPRPASTAGEHGGRIVRSFGSEWR